MTNNEKELLSTLKDLRLSEGTRTRMRANLAAYAELHAMPKKEQVSFNSVSFMSGMFSHSRKLVAGVLMVAAIVGVGGATTYAAESALPNEPLYAVKVGINEPALAVFAGSGAAQAKLHAKLAVRRVVEAEVLREMGVLTPETEATLTARFSQEADRAIVEAEKLESSGDVSTSLAVRAELTDSLQEYIVPAEPEITEGAQLPAPMQATMVAKQTVSVKKATVTVPLLRGVISKKIAEIGEEKKRSAEEKESVIDSRVGKSLERSHQNAARALLSGSSVVSTNPSVTDASSTPLRAKRPLKALLESRDHVRESNEPEKSGAEAIQKIQSIEQKIEPILSPLSL